MGGPCPTRGRVPHTARCIVRRIVSIAVCGGRPRAAQVEPSRVDYRGVGKQEGHGLAHVPRSGPPGGRQDVPDAVLSAGARLKRLRVRARRAAGGVHALTVPRPRCSLALGQRPPRFPKVACVSRRCCRILATGPSPRGCSLHPAGERLARPSGYPP